MYIVAAFLAKQQQKTSIIDRTVRMASIWYKFIINRGNDREALEQNRLRLGVSQVYCHLSTVK